MFLLTLLLNMLVGYRGDYCTFGLTQRHLGSLWERPFKGSVAEEKDPDSAIVKPDYHSLHEIKTSFFSLPLNHCGPT